MANILDLIKGEFSAIQYIESLASTDLSPSEILSTLSNSGIQIRRAAGLTTINYFRGTVIPSSKYVQALNLNSYPTIVRLPLSATKLLRNFSYRVKLTGFLKTTGELVDNFINISTHSLLTKQQAIDAAVEIAGASDSKYSVTGASGKVTDIFQNSGGLISPGTTSTIPTPGNVSGNTYPFPPTTVI